MKSEKPQAGTVLPAAARDALTRYLDRRLHAARTTITSPTARFDERGRASAIMREAQAVQDLLARAQDAARRAVDWQAGDPRHMERARAYYARYAEQFAESADKATREKTRRMFDLATVEMELLVELLAPPPEVEPRPTVQVEWGEHEATLFCTGCGVVFDSIDDGEDLDSVNRKRDAHTCTSRS